jgi:hypothetical protein
MESVQNDARLELGGGYESKLANDFDVSIFNRSHLAKHH